MYLDFEDSHPETPTLRSPISVREGVLLAFIAHLVVMILILLAPRYGWFQRPVAPMTPQQNITFVETLNKSELPKYAAAGPDAPRRPAPAQQQPQIAAPPPKGNADDRADTTPKDRARTDTPIEAPTPPAPSSLTYVAGGQPAAPGLANSLHNLDRYLQNMNFDAPQQGGSIGRDNAIEFDSKGVDFTWWLARFKAQVYAHWIFPLAAQSLSGHVVIQFVVHKDGRMTDLQILDPGKIESFWVAAKNALVLSRFPALPAEYPLDAMPMTVTFLYNELIRR
jgi:hypothetical protein